MSTIKEIKCGWRETYETGNSTTFQIYEHNPKLRKCVKCNGFDKDCELYRDYLQLMMSDNSGIGDGER